MFASPFRQMMAPGSMTAPSVITFSLPMTLMRVVKARTAPKVELLVDGHSGFLFLDKSGMPNPL